MSGTIQQPYFLLSPLSAAYGRQDACSIRAKSLLFGYWKPIRVNSNLFLCEALRLLCAPL